jgi:hypothetical protein
MSELLRLFRGRFEPGLCRLTIREGHNRSLQIELRGDYT